MTSKLPAPAGQQQWYTPGSHTGITPAPAPAPASSMIMCRSASFSAP